MSCRRLQLCPIGPRRLVVAKRLLIRFAEFLRTARYPLCGDGSKHVDREGNGSRSTLDRLPFLHNDDEKQDHPSTEAHPRLLREAAQRVGI